MTVGLPDEFVCSQGHRWRSHDHPAGRSNDDGLRCPICGASAREIPPGASPSDRSDSDPGRSKFPALPGYAILGVLGRGRAGVVYEARERARNRRVALEVIESGRDAASGDPRDVQVDPGATRLHHPNIVPVLAAGHHEGAEFLASEYVEGGKLSEYHGGGPLPVLTAAEVVETLARAMHEAHRLGFHHGGLDADRVLLAPSSPPRFVDPELGHLCEENGRELIPRITGFGMTIAAGAGRAPEAPVAADVFGLGSILFELLTGQAPPDADSIDPGADSPSARNPKVPKDLEAICLACLAPDPSRRLADAGLVADALRQFLDTFVTQFQCGHCSKAIKSRKPVRVGTTVVRCPRCGRKRWWNPWGARPILRRPTSLPTGTSRPPRPLPRRRTTNRPPRARPDPAAARHPGPPSIRPRTTRLPAPIEDGIARSR